MKLGNVWTVARKEFARFFGDRRVVITTRLVPGLLIYVIYSFMGDALGNMFSVSEDYRPAVYAVNMPASILPLALSEEMNFEVTNISAGEIASAKEKITAKELDLLAVFPEDFDAAVAAYTPESGTAAPTVDIYYNSTETDSSTAFERMFSLLGSYEGSLANRFDVNSGSEDHDLASAQDETGFVFSSMLPMLLMIFLFTGCMSVGPEAIAGEKERGTIATMLITPMKRSELAVGKIISLGAIALLAGASSTLGTMLSLPKLMGGAGSGMTAAFYTASDYIMLTGVVLSTVLVFISLIALISAYAKSTKEAQTAVMPLMIIAMLVGLTGMFAGQAQTDTVLYLIPIYNSVQAMMEIFSFSVVGLHILVTIITNLVVSITCSFALTAMFNSEKCMFNK
jgi:sodium transport system permease protein